MKPERASWIAAALVSLTVLACSSSSNCQAELTCDENGRPITREDAGQRDAGAASGKNPTDAGASKSDTEDSGTDTQPSPEASTEQCNASEEKCDDACVDLSSDADHCGGCGRACSASGANSTSCVKGTCVPVCKTGFVDDSQPSVDEADDGCEINLMADPDNCGMLGFVCSGDNVQNRGCEAGKCVPECETGFSDCSTAANDGCETNINNDVDHCGRCDRSCSSDNVMTRMCAGGLCTPTCNPWFDSCSAPPANSAGSDADDGCETNLQLASSCGSCNRVCDVVAACTDETSVTFAYCEPKSLAGIAPEVFAGDEDAFYYNKSASGGKHDIVRVTLPGLTEQTVVASTEKMASFVENATHRFWGSLAGAFRQNKETNKIDPVVAAQLAPTAIALDDTHLYWNSTYNSNLQRAPLSDLVSAETLQYSIPNQASIAVGPSYIYWTHDGILRYEDKTMFVDGYLTVLYSESPLVGVRALTQNGTEVLAGTSSEIYRIDGGTATKIADVNSLYAMKADASGIYALENQAGSGIIRHDGLGNATPIVPMFSNLRTHIALSAGHIIYYDEASQISIAVK